MFHSSNKNGLGSVSHPVVPCPCTPKNEGSIRPLAILAQASQHLWLVTLDGFYQQFTLLALPLSLVPFRMMLADSLLPHGFGLPLSGMGYVVPPASYRPVTRAACGGRLLPRERQVSSLDFSFVKQLLKRRHVAPFRSAYYTA